MSDFFKSEQVQDNLQDIFNTYQEVASMTSQLATMNKQDCKVLIDKQKTFYGRLCLAASEDSEAADMKTRINALSQAFGYMDLLECMDAMVETLELAAQREVDDD